jgi:hypothetical protein
MASVDVASADARFEFGRVVGQTFGLIGRNFIVFLMMALVFVGAPQFAIYYVQSTVGISDPSLTAPIGLAGVLVSLVTSYILQGALTRAAIDDLSGAGVKFGAALGDGLRYFFPLFVVGLLVGIGMAIGLVLLIIPGLILAVRWAVSAPIVVVEKHGPTNSIGRSAELTKGYRWPIFGLLVLYTVFAYVVQIVFVLTFAALSGGDPTQISAMDGLGIALGVASAAVAAVISLVSTVGVAALYFELRRVKEGVGVAELAAVFE